MFRLGPGACQTWRFCLHSKWRCVEITQVGLVWRGETHWGKLAMRVISIPGLLSEVMKLDAMNQERVREGRPRLNS